MPDLLIQLEGYGKQLDEEARPLSLSPPAAQQHPRRAVWERPWAVAGFAAIITLVLIGAAAWLLRSDAVEPATPMPAVPETWDTWGPADGIVSECACEMAVAADGSIWLVGFDGISRFDGSSWERIAPPAPFAGEGWPSVAPAPDGSVWVSGMSYIAQYDRGEWGPPVTAGYGMDEGDPVFFESVWVHGDGSVWTGLMDETGVIENGRFVPRAEPEPAERPDYEPPEGLSIAAVSPDGSIWMTMGDSITGVDGALVVLDGEDLTRYSLGGVGMVVFEPDGTGWFLVPQVGSDAPLYGEAQWSAPGLYRLEDGVWFRITVEDGLGSYRIKSAVTTPDGAFWLAADDGTVTRYQPGTDPQAGTVVEIESRPFTDSDLPPPAYPPLTEPPPG